ncbi:tripartite tricarboxylate transporter substrate binding protein [Sporosarcina thermotolerans]|uniref:Tripartite tricarboxylate transporter substrate binding protein n=1 Tax=Sporosarcina thermotolerans TaxID=633404 RepID=A0AAW9A7E3_9BACL|nr:tripartite tricarboxylate transporter substrate binding protein [Sporosarcina thermotolerans]MDW0116164.1 tripartite tricarboxylate transporter substrate binding protein [Sporosarcina thermotolerans]WHT48139.1 tripartite tricarboxylate transporter substrate binding protein [Sporosarcina thermotolerans]
MRKLSITALICALMLVLGACSEKASGEVDKNYPSKPITVIQGFNPGGGSDQLAQLTQPYLSKILDATFTSEYIPGAAGAIGWTRVAQKEKADGYSISITNSPMLMTNYIMNSDISYTLEDFDPIANIVTDPGIIVVPKDSKLNTYEDFAKYLEDNPNGLNVSHSGVGGDDFFTALKWMNETGLSIELIPYDGDGPSWQAAAGGDVEVSFNNLGVVFAQVKAGNLKALAVFSEERIELLPDVPTAKELGVNVVSGSSRGYSAPKGLPEEIKQKLYDAFKQLENDPEFVAGLEKVALPMDIKIGEDYAEFLKEDEKLSEKLWEEVKDQYKE